MGGLLALALAALKPESVRALALLATPWDFHAPDAGTGGALAAAYRELARQVEPAVLRLGHLPVDVIQGLFALMQPMQSAAKFAAFAAMDPGSAEARRFVLTEGWLNDGVPLTAGVARECLGSWYGENATGRGAWRVGGTLVNPAALTMPAYVVVPGRDKIVPPESALPLAKLLPRATLHEPMLGHVGLMASSKAPHQVWAPLFKWMAERV
jgi:poly(3-hydroxyalkanoate) synthetase